MTVPEMFELMNGYWAMLDLCLLFILVRYLILEGFDIKDPSCKFALAMTIYFSGDMARQCWAWVIWTIRNTRESITHANATWWMPVIFSTVATCGILFLIYTTCPKKCKHWGWVVSWLLAVTVVYANFRYNIIWR